MKKLVVAMILVLVCGCVSSCVSHPALVSVGGDTDARIKALQDQLNNANSELTVTKKQLKQMADETLVFMNLKDSTKGYNFRLWATIKTVAKFVAKVMYQMVVATWASDWLWIAFWIMLMTWLGSFASKFVSLITGFWGTLVKALTFWMSFSGNLKIVTTIIWAFLLAAIWKWTHSPADWSYVWIVSACSCALANIAWEFFINKTKISDKVSALTHKVLSEKLKIKTV